MSMALPDPVPAASPDRDRGAVVIEPHRGWIGVNWGEMLRYRELLYFLIWRDVKVKYKQATLGIAWALFIPLLSMIVYSIAGGFFGLSDRVPGLAPGLYPLYIFSGLIPWLFIQRALNDGGMSLLNQQALMTKIYLPRLYLPMSAVGGALVDMAIMFFLLAGVGLFFHFHAEWTPSWQIVFLVPLLLLTLVAATGIAFTLSSAIVLYRDLRFMVPFITQFGLWFSAVVFPPAVFKGYENYFAINPIAGIISGYRSAILGTPWEWPLLASSLTLCPLLLLFGLFYFKRVERRFADIA